MQLGGFLDGVGMLFKWAFDREAREKARLYKACQSARAYIAVDEKSAPYDKLTDKQVKDYKLHFKKRVMALS